MKDQEAKNYANELIEQLKETQKSFGEEGLITPIFHIWVKLVRARCREVLKKYLKGEVDTYKLSDVDMTELYEKAKNDFIDESLMSLLDKGLLEVSIREDGEFMYGLSDKGRDLAELLTNYPNDDSDDK